MIGLTRKQSAALDFVQGRLRETGIPPSFQEIADALGLKSKSGVHRLLSALERDGYIRRIKRRARCMEVVRLYSPPASAPPPFIARQTVTLNSEILTLTDRYAAQESISRDTATNQIMREWLEAYFRRAA
jgi:SOS-response transcriptional repressor LexA